MTHQLGSSEPYGVSEGQGSAFGSLSETHDPRREADLRQQALERLRFMNIQHAMYAWERRYSDPISPYGLAFLFAQPAGKGQWQELKAATKLWLAGPESADLARLLFDLNTVVVGQASGPDFDLRRDVANRSDAEMRDDAWYVGVGLSSLDTYSGPWEAACARAGAHTDIPGTVLISMIDSTVITCDRRGLNEFGAMQIKSSQALGTSPLDRANPWQHLAAEELRLDVSTGSLLRWLEELNHNLWRVDNATLVQRREPWA